MDELSHTVESVDVREEIARLEERIEDLETNLDSCHKFAAASRFAMGLGVVLLGGILIGVIPFDELAMIGGMAAGIGGVVMAGSNSSTAKETQAALEEA